MRTLLLLLLLNFYCYTGAGHNADLARNGVYERTADCVSMEKSSSWWGYFDGDYSNVVGQGLGGGMPFPLRHNCAIKLERTNPEILGKRIKAVKFAFMSMDFIEDVKIWMSTILPIIPEDADICCQTVDLTTLNDIESGSKANEIAFEEPYQFGGSDIYVGYSFTVTSRYGDLNTYPIAVDESTTAGNAFFFDYGNGWTDYAGSESGNLALMILVDDDAVPVPGDANYDTQVNVGDISATIEYIMNGNVNPFNKTMADIDGNGEINIVDAASIADMVLGIYETPSDKHTESCSDVVTITEKGASADINLAADNVYKAFQMDVVMPSYDEITSVRLNEALVSTHVIRHERIADGRYRIAVYPSAGDCIDSDINNLLTIGTSATDIKVENIIFATSDLRERRLGNAIGTDAADICEVRGDRLTNSIYTINGVKVSGQDCRKGNGIYIINGVKTMVR